MTGVRKVLACVALIAFLILFVWWRVTSLDLFRGDRPPPAIRNRTVIKIDEEMLDTKELRHDLWDQYYSRELAKWQNPETEEYTMVPTKKCGSCGKIVPRVVFPPSEFKGLSDLQADFKKERMQAEYRCPLCGGPVYD